MQDPFYKLCWGSKKADGEIQRQSPPLRRSGDATRENYFRNFYAEKSKAHLQHMYENDKGGLK